jgi:Transposase DDE domain
MIFADALPKINTFLRPADLPVSTATLLIRLIAAFLGHPGRRSASAAAQAIRSQARHRAQLTRFLARCRWSKDWSVLQSVADLLLQQEAGKDGTWLFLLDQTYCGHQGPKTENTFSCGNRQRRPKKGRRYQKRKSVKRSCHGFVMGLLITPSGFRIPSCRCYYTEDYCQAQGFDYQTQIDWAAELIATLAVPAGASVVVLGDTAFEAQTIRTACAARGFVWVVPMNPERVLAGDKPRPKVNTLAQQLSAEHYEAVRLQPGQGVYAAQARAARCRLGSKAKARTFWVHPERRVVHNIGEVLLVFSTKEQPQPNQPVPVQKVLMTNGVQWTAAEVVAVYALRWQVELFFKELKGTLGFHQYRFRKFAKVEAWVQACLVAFVYLEWWRAQQLRRGEGSEAERRWWQQQRSYGLCLALRQRAEERDLAKLFRWSGTKTGRKKLRRTLRQALPLEYRQPA